MRCNGASGVQLGMSGTANNTISGSYIATDAAGNTPEFYSPLVLRQY